MPIAETLSTLNTNGQAASEAVVAQVLEDEVTVGYVPTVPLEAMWASGSPMPQITVRRDIEFMQFHPIVISALEYYKSGIAGAEFWGGPDHQNPDNDKGKPISLDSRVAEFVLAHCERFWQRGMPLLQDGGYPYGWIGGEHIYKSVNGMMIWSHLKDFHPNDAYILTGQVDTPLAFEPLGIRVKNVRNKQPIDLWFASKSIPAKACWYPHRPRFNQFYGRTQLSGGWLPWRRLGWRDGVEQVIDAAIYRAGYRGPIVGHPQEDMQTAQQGVPATRQDEAGNPRRSARDVARQMIEYGKAGAGFTKSTAKYSQAEGGGDKWTIDWPDHVMDVGPLIKGAEYLENQIMLGICVPPELVKAGGTGSGYSGRSIPREAFLSQQQKVADAMLQIFVEQVIKPLVMWNFGDVAFEVSCKSLLKSQAGDKQADDPNSKGQQQKPGQSGNAQEPPKQPAQGSGGNGQAMSHSRHQTDEQRQRVLNIVQRVLRKIA